MKDKKDGQIIILLLILETIVMSIIGYNYENIIGCLFITFFGNFFILMITGKGGAAILSSFLCTFGLACLLWLVNVIIPNIKDVPFGIKFFFLIIATIIVIILLEYLNKFIKIKKIEKENRKNADKYNYYREILKQYSAAVLGIVYNKKVKYSDLLIATLLNLVLKDFIKINSKGICILEKESKNLDLNEEFILEKIVDNIRRKDYNNICIPYKSIKNVFNDEDFKEKWYNKIQKDAEMKKLYNIKTISFEKMKKVFNLFFVIIFIFSIVGNIMFTNFSDDIFLKSYVVVLILLFLLIVVIKKIIEIGVINVCIRTKEGVDIQNKLLGLKRYIKDYSNIKNTKVTETNIWEEYSIYAIIFDLKGNLDKDTNILYKKILNL